VFSSLFTFWVKKEFWSKKVFGTEFHQGQNKGKVFIKLAWFKSLSRVPKRSLKDLFEVSFSCLNMFCSKLFKKSKHSIFVHAWVRKIGFQFWKIGELSKRENLILCECDWDYSSLGKILELFIVLTICLSWKCCRKEKNFILLRVSVVSESRWDKDGVVCP